MCYHELGHAQLMSMYPGETEAINNFMYTFIAHTKFGVPFDKAFNDGMDHSNYTPDDAAVHWMVTPQFRAGNEMDHSNTEHDQMRCLLLLRPRSTTLQSMAHTSVHVHTPAKIVPHGTQCPPA